MPPPTDPVAAVAAPLISLTDVSKTFQGRRGDTVALAHVNLEVGSGELVSLIGPSGCGKSTLLRVVGGLLGADGAVTVAGSPPGSARAGKQFGLVPQTPALLPWRTVRANVRLLTEVNRGAEAHTVLSAADTDELLAEVGLGEVLDAHPRELSGGMQQRVALVRAFALGAPILLMDEPFAALDEITRDEMRYLLLRLWERTGSTVLFVTHSIEEAVVLSDRVAVMSPRPGRITAVEPVTLPRPRTAEIEDTVEFLGHVSRIRHALRDGMGR
jgi:NitT/TauT family transport system ATP-binding protein